jgi:hypothetical protein
MQLLGQQQQGTQSTQGQQPAAPATPAQVAVANNGGALKGNPPVHFTGESSKSCGFLTTFNLYKEANHHNKAIKNPYFHVTTTLTYMIGDTMESWKEDQLQQLRNHVTAGTPDTDEHHWQLFEADFCTSFTNINATKDTCTELARLHQGESLDKYITKFKQLA